MSEQPKGIVRRIAHGAAGLAKVAAGADRADKATVTARLAVCGDCEQGAGRRLCGACGCVIKVKVRLASEACPEGKWPAIT